VKMVFRVDEMFYLIIAVKTINVQIIHHSF